MSLKEKLNLLESLKFADSEKGASTENEPMSESCLKHNIAVLENIISKPAKDVLRENCLMLLLHFEEKDNENIELDDLQSIYVVYMQHVLLKIIAETNFNSEDKNDLLSTFHMNLIIKSIQDLSKIDFMRFLHPAFLNSKVFDREPARAKNVKTTPLPIMKMCSIEFFNKILSVKQFHIANSMEFVIRDYMAAIFSLYILEETSEMNLKLLQQKLDTIWLKMGKSIYFHNLMLFKGLPELPTKLQKKLHQELHQKLASKDGFINFVAVLQTVSQKRQDNNIQQNAEIVANIVAFPGHSLRFQKVMIHQIFSFLNQCLKLETVMENMSIGLLALRRLYDLKAETREMISEYVYAPLKKLSEPIDVLSGLIVMEHVEFCESISFLYQLFYTSSIECLPSEMLVCYLPMFLELYYNLPESLPQKRQLAHLVARCLNNRENDELQEIIKKLYTRDFKTNWKQLHERIVPFPNSAQTEIQFKIASADFKSESSISLSLPALLMEADHSLLTYNVFMALLQLMSTYLLEPNNSELDVNLLDNEDELIALLNAKYPIKIEIVLSLNSLISYQPLKSQISERSREFLKLLRQLIEERIKTHIFNENIESTDQILLLMITLTQELLLQTHLPEEHSDFWPILQKLYSLTPNILVQQRVSTLISMLNGEVKSNAFEETSAFQTARSLLEAHEPHIQVYGIQMLLDLLRKRDTVTLSNGHIIVALALSTLKNKESYTFLNSVRLFVSLVNVMETEVLEILADEYLNETGTLDFRLVVGEAIIKVSQELGPLCYKYKDVLLNTFMHGARSQIDEFRLSSFANLAQLCRTLCYQVLKFFQELLQLVDCELSNGKYLPSKRAALFVLSELLEGIENLMDFEEMLLPIYRLLKLIGESENCDEKMRIHAINGLKALSEKCKKFLFPEEVLQKEIQIFGIKEEPRKNKTKHILEIN